MNKAWSDTLSSSKMDYGQYYIKRTKGETEGIHFSVISFSDPELTFWLN